MSILKKFFDQMSWYTGNMLANAAVGLLVVPVIVTSAGADQWGSIAVGQAVGSIATILTALGWGYNGPSLIARADAQGRILIAAHSIVARTTVFPIIIVIASFVASQLTPVNPAAAAMACISVGLAGLGMSWYFVGEGQPRKLFIFDGSPRWLGSVLGVAALVVSRDIYLLLWFQVAGGLVSSALSISVVILGSVRAPRDAWHFGSAFRGVKKQLYAGVTVITATSFAALPTLVIAGLAPASVPVYALGERLLRLALMTVTPFNQWIQGWVPRVTPERSQERRIEWAVKVAFSLAIPIGGAVAFFGPLAGEILSAGIVQIPYVLTIFLGAAVALSIVSRVVGMACLLAVGRDREVALSAVLAAIVGTPLLFMLVTMSGATGAALSLAISELIVLVIQLIALRKWMKLK